MYSERNGTAGEGFGLCGRVPKKKKRTKDYYCE